ncbi:MAG: hypothetical protein O3B22_02185 [Proteobacteria bacterium]|nr:hypothetical protein [Pseudomonadota bacterium]MDA0951061.1 hypothetical protein [Pseudomonadota bacterium]
MSRLDSVIRRLTAQRACLGLAASLIEGLDGHVLELGLGNGRTFDHLREILPGREIFCFDRQVAAHPDCIPDPDHLFLGELEATLPQAVARLGARAALVHVDIGSGDEAASRRLGAWLAGRLPSLLAPGAVLISDQPLPQPDWRTLELPEGVRQGRYFLYRA